MVAVMTVMATPSKGLMPALLYLVPLTPQQATIDPRLRWRLLGSHWQVWLSLLWGHCSFLLAPGVHKVLFVPSKVKFPAGSQSLCWIPRLGNLLWILETSTTLR